MDVLPDELLERIFTITCEEPLPSKFRGPGHQPSHRTTIGAFQAQRRRRKPDAGSLALVCRRWRFLIDMKYNAHLWQIGLKLMNASVPKLCDDVPKRMAVFKEAISNAKGCDIHVQIELGYFGDTVEQELLMHGALMLRQYRRQLKTLGLIVGDDATLRFAGAFLSNLGYSPRLEQVAIFKKYIDVDMDDERPCFWDIPFSSQVPPGLQYRMTPSKLPHISLKSLFPSLAHLENGPHPSLLSSKLFHGASKAWFFVSFPGMVPQTHWLVTS